ncbi:UNKNOWN [Stylonychia lemnae]|uniref:Uncharacterized protein n=1 Tax=Stylonychia lemnae TaxID=5949 RepID=A0A078A1Z7_STYLE|nr:UNKNOWN [Stylonychia lemnae]|eukprot:CDW75822.1 UNKNOWN [Stylonychia lemnae]
MQSKMQYYLYQTGIDELLNDAFKQVAINKPSDPIVYIAQYLRNGQNLILLVSLINQPNKYNVLKKSTIQLINQEDLDRPFTEEGAITITKNKVVGINYQQIKTNLIAIAENQVQENDEIDSDEEIPKIRPEQVQFQLIQILQIRIRIQRTIQNST